MTSLLLTDKSLKIKYNEELGKSNSIFPSIESKVRDTIRHNTSFQPLTSKKKTNPSNDDIGSFKSTVPSHITYKDFKMMLENQQREIEERNEMVTHLQQNFENLKLQHIREKNDMMELSKNMQSLKELNVHLTNKLKLQSQKMDEYKFKIEKLEKESSEVKEVQRRASLKNLEPKEAINNINQSKLLEARTLLETLKGDIVAKDRLVSETNAVLESKKLKCKDYKRKLQQNEFILKDSTIQIESLKKSISNHNSEKASLNQILNETVRKWEETVKSLNKDIETLRDENFQLKEKLSFERDLSFKLENLKTENNALKTIMMSQEREIEIYRERDTENKEAREENQRLLKQIKAKDKELEENETVIYELKKKIETFVRAPTTGSTKLNNLDSEIKYLKEKLDSKIDTLPLADKNKKGQERSLDKNERNTKEGIEKLEKAEKELISSVKCLFCLDLIKQPVTCIPCGHSYCQGCSQAYNSSCYKCGPSHRVDAIYRNELLEDLLKILKTVQDLTRSLKQR